MSWWRISSFKAVGLDLFLQVCLREENRLLVNKITILEGTMVSNGRHNNRPTRIALHPSFT